MTRSRQPAVLVGAFFVAVTAAFWAVESEPLPAAALLLLASGG